MRSNIYRLETVIIYPIIKDSVIAGTVKKVNKF